MNRKSKLIIASVAILGVLTTGGTLALAVSKSSSSPMDLNDVIKATSNGNSSLKLYDKKIEVGESAYKEAFRKPDKESAYQEYMRLKVNPDRRKFDLNNLKWEKEQKQDEVILTSKQYYYQFKIQDDMIQLQNNKVERLKKLLDYKKKKIQLGTEPKYTLIDAESNLKDAETTLQKIKNEKENIRMKLNINMGTNVDAALNLKPEDVPYKEFKVNNLDGIVNKMVEEYHTIASMNEDKKLYIIERDIANLYYDRSDSTNELKNAKNPSTDYKSWVETLGDSIVNLEYNISDEKRNIDAKLRMDYNTILNLNNEVSIKKLDCDKAESLLKAEQTKYKVGQSTKIDCDSAEETLKMAKCEYNKAKSDYFVAVEQFKNYTKKFL